NDSRPPAQPLRPGHGRPVDDDPPQAGTIGGTSQRGERVQRPGPVSEQAARDGCRDPRHQPEGGGEDVLGNLLATNEPADDEGDEDYPGQGRWSYRQPEGSRVVGEDRHTFDGKG